MKVEVDRCRSLLTCGLMELRLDPVRGQVDRLVGLASLLDRWSQRINLTGHRSLEQIARRLVLEAAALLAHLPELGTLADLGSGAGFPGFPIAILRPEWTLTLVEARERRHHFQRAAVRELALQNVRLVRGRAEIVEPIPHAGAVAQAMAEPRRALVWTARWVEPGGLVVLPRSLAQPAIPPPPEIQFERTIHYEVPCGGPQRLLWLGRRRHLPPET